MGLIKKQQWNQLQEAAAHGQSNPSEAQPAPDAEAAMPAETIVVEATPAPPPPADPALASLAGPGPKSPLHAFLEQASAGEAAPTAPAAPQDQVILEEARQQAAELVERARQEAKKLLEESRLYCQSAHTQARREGFEVGREEGVDAVREEYRAYFDEARNVLGQMVSERDRILSQAETEIARLSVKVAERIISCEVTTNHEVVVNMVKTALERVKDREQVSIRVNPQDYEVVRSKREVFAALVEGLRNLEIAQDPRVERGGCVIETNLGNVDARVSTQLAALELAFRGVDRQDGPDTGAQESAA